MTSPLRLRVPHALHIQPPDEDSVATLRALIAPSGFRSRLKATGTSRTSAPRAAPSLLPCKCSKISRLISRFLAVSSISSPKPYKQKQPVQDPRHPATMITNPIKKESSNIASPQMIDAIAPTAHITIAKVLIFPPMSSNILNVLLCGFYRHCSIFNDLCQTLRA